MYLAVFNKTFFELLVIKNLNINMLTKLQQYLGKYINRSCLNNGHVNKNGVHLPQLVYQ